MRPPEAASRWLPYTPPRPDAAVRVFCFPHAGGSATVYRPWVGQFPAGTEVLPVEYPGRRARACEPAHTRMETLVADAAAGLLEYLDRPYILFGHSLGAAVAYELARTLGRSGERQPEHLFVASHRAPHLPAPIADGELPDQELFALVRGLGGTPVGDQPDGDQLRVLRADLATGLGYRYQPAAPLDCPVTALGGADDPIVSPEQLAAWRQHSRREVRVSLLPGGHFFLCNPRAVIDLIAGACVATTEEIKDD